MAASTVLIAVIAATTASAAPIVHGPPAVAASVLAAERAFSDRFGHRTIAEGMRDYIADDGLAFTGVGDPVLGGADAFTAFGGAAPSTLRLTWMPAEIFAASAGDMAASWGHFTLADSVAGSKLPAVTGRYVTVWHKGTAGWQAIMDIGNPDVTPR